MLKHHHDLSDIPPDTFNPFVVQKKPRHGFIRWVRTHKLLSSVIGGITVITIGTAITLAALGVFSPHPTPPTPVLPPTPVAPAPEPIHYYSPLTGLEVSDEAATTQPVTAVMIENSPEARPQSGLKDSGVVFEAIAEGGITRFAALYQEQKPSLIGPVRSVRMYYVDWIAAFNASIAHVGGSAAALKEVRNGSYRDIDQFFNGPSYWRATDRYAPHNVYTSFTRLGALNKEKGYTQSSFTGFTRKDSTASNAPTATTVDITISSALFNSQYRYNKKTNTYDRWQAGAPHKDREEGTISPRVVIAMKVDESTVQEDGWREQINAIGKGTAYLFQDGGAQTVTWQKKSKTAQITFTNKEGEDVPLARGQTWIVAVPNNGGKVTWK